MRRGIFNLLLSCFLFSECVKGDLPVHETTVDVAGPWVFVVGEIGGREAASWSEDAKNATETGSLAAKKKAAGGLCATGVPNSNVENLQTNPEIWFEKNDSPTETLSLTLSDKPILVEETSYLLKNAEGGNYQENFLSHFPESRKGWKLLPVYSKDGALVGRWTMIFDEGFEVTYRLPGSDTSTQLLAFMNYNKVDSSRCSQAKDGDGIEADGSTPCYETDSGKTYVGWTAVRDDRKGTMQWGCFIARKAAKPTDFPRMVEVKATVSEGVPSREQARHGILVHRKTSRLVAPATEFPHNAPVASFLQTKATLGLATGLYACPKALDSFVPNQPLPAAFSWGDPFTDPNFESEDDEAIINQGDCGSCYSVSATYVLQKRAQIALERLLGNHEEWKTAFANGKRVSAQAPMSCSHYNQGCAGGYPVLVGKWAVEFGVPTVDCMEYTARDTVCQMQDVIDLIDPQFSVGTAIGRFDPSDFRRSSSLSPPPILRRRLPPPQRHSHHHHGSRSADKAQRSNGSSLAGRAVLSPTEFSRPLSSSLPANDARTSAAQVEACGNDNRVFASTYGYVGGCYECCSERAMMNELYHHGPIAIAFDAPQELFRHKGGVFDKRPASHSRICDEPERGLNGWEFTTHALVVVGWGEEPPAKEGDAPTKYWTVRNSWGRKWGEDGYFKLIRGQNSGAVEAQAVFIDPDPTRGKLKALLDKHSVSSEKAHKAIFAARL